MLKRGITIIGIISMLSVVAQSEPATYSSFNGIHQPYLSLRALAMGNAFTAVVDDYNAILYNPAALARRKTAAMHGSLGGGISDDFSTFADDVSTAAEATPGTEIDAMTAVLNKNFGKNFHARFPKLAGTWVRPNWGVAFIPMDVNLDMVVNRSGGGPAININLTNDTTIAYGYGRNVDWFKKWFSWDGTLSVGVTAKLINRIFVGEVISVAKAVSNNGDFFNKDDADEGLTLDADLGVMFTPKLPDTGVRSWFRAAKPTFSAVLRNVADYGFTTNLNTVSETSGEPPKLQRRLDLGSVWDLPDFWVFDPHLAVDIKDILHDQWTFKKGFHLGAELYWRIFDWWKGSWALGLNQGYLTYGVGARFSWFQMDLVSYGEELGSSANPVESRRYMFEMSLDF